MSHHDSCGSCQAPARGKFLESCEQELVWCAAICSCAMRILSHKRHLHTASPPVPLSGRVDLASMYDPPPHTSATFTGFAQQQQQRNSVARQPSPAMVPLRAPTPMTASIPPMPRRIDFGGPPSGFAHWQRQGGASYGGGMAAATSAAAGGYNDGDGGSDDTASTTSSDLAAPAAHRALLARQATAGRSAAVHASSAPLVARGGPAFAATGPRGVGGGGATGRAAGAAGQAAQAQPGSILGARLRRASGLLQGSGGW